MKSTTNSFINTFSSCTMIFKSDNKQHCVQLDDCMNDVIGRSNTMSTVHHVEMNSQEETTKLITILEKLLNQSNHQKNQLEQKLQQHINRSIKRERQFYRIIDNYVARTNHSSQSFNTIRSLDEDNIKNLHSQLMDRVQQSDQKLQKKYDHLYKENLKIMERKITSLSEKMQEELKKSKQISNDQTGEMKSLMVKLGDMAVEVQGRNGELMRRNNDLELKLQMLSEEKRLLLEQICQKRNLLRNYHHKCKSYEAILKQNPNSIQFQTNRNNKHNNSIQSVSKKKSISQSSNVNNKSLNEYAGMISFGSKDNGLVGSGNKTISNIHSQKRKRNLISRNFSVNHNSNNQVTSLYPHYQHFTSHQKSINNRINNQKKIQQIENNNKIFSTQFVTNHDIIKLEKVRNSHVDRKCKKDYISSLTMARTNTPMQKHQHHTINNNQQIFINQTVTNNNNKLTTSTTQQSSHQALFFKENTKSINKNTEMKINKKKQVGVDNCDDNQDMKKLPNNKSNGCCQREMNAVNSIRNVANREKQKKLECMSRLAQLQRKLTAIDGLVSDALVQLSDMEALTRQHRSGCKDQQQQENSPREQILSFAKVLCDQLKNIIATNYNSSNLNHSNITLNHHVHSHYYLNQNGYYSVPINDNQMEYHPIPLSQQQQQKPQGKQITTAQLIKLLDAELISHID